MDSSLGPPGLQPSRTQAGTLSPSGSSRQAAVPGCQSAPILPAAPSQEQLLPILLALVHSLMGNLPAENPARLQAAAALELMHPPPPCHG